MKMKTMILLAAVMLGLSPARAQEKQQKSPEHRAAKITEWMKTNLKLSDDQVTKVDEINKRYAMKVEDIRKNTPDKKQKKSSIKALDKDKDGELKAVLSEDQFKSYLAKKEEMKEQAKQKKKEQKGKE